MRGKRQGAWSIWAIGLPVGGTGFRFNGNGRKSGAPSVMLKAPQPPVGFPREG